MSPDLLHIILHYGKRWDEQHVLQHANCRLWIAQCFAAFRRLSQRDSLPVVLLRNCSRAEHSWANMTNTCIFSMMH